MTIRSDSLTSLRSISPPMMQPARNGWSSGITPLHFVVVSTGAPSRSANFTNSAEALHQIHAQADEQDRPPARDASMSSAGLRSARSGPGIIEVRQQRRLGDVSSPASRVVSLCGNSKCTGPGGVAVAVRMARRTCWRTDLGVDRGAPFHDRLVDRELVEALAQPDLVGRPRIGIGDRDQRRAVEKSVGDAVDHVGGAGPACRQADAGAAGDVAPGRGQHGAGDLLLHQQEPHLALARRLHQLDQFAAGMPDDEGRAGILERGRQHFDRGGHWQKSPEYFLLLPSPWQNLPWFPTVRGSPADSYIAVIHYYINALSPADFRRSRCAGARGRYRRAAAAAADEKHYQRRTHCRDG